MVLSPSPSPSPSPLVSSSPTVGESFPPAPPTESADQAAVRAGLIAYWRAVDQFLKDPSLKDLTDLQRVTVNESEEARAATQLVVKFRERGWILRGDRSFRDVKISIPVGEVKSRTASAAYCHDITANRVVLSTSGEPADVSPIPTLKETVVLEEGLDGIWRVSQIRNEKVAC